MGRGIQILRDHLSGRVLGKSTTRCILFLSSVPSPETAVNLAEWRRFVGKRLVEREGDPKGETLATGAAERSPRVCAAQSSVPGESRLGLLKCNPGGFQPLL